MDISYNKTWSGELGRDMEYKRYGYAGRPVVVFPTSQGTFYQFEDQGAVGSLGELIDAGRIQLFTIDGVDSESFFDKGGEHAGRIARHEAYFRYVRNEALPEFGHIAAASNGGQSLKPIFTGCSMGAFHAANFVFRFPDVTSGVVALSGVYSTKGFLGDDLSGDIFYNSPLDYLANLEDPATLDEIRSLRLIICCGRGAWEEPMITETHALERVLAEKDIPAWVDFWGTDVAHDWVSWHKQLPYFFGRWLDEDLEDRKA